MAVKREYFDEDLVQRIADSFTADVASFENAIRQASRANPSGAPSRSSASPPECQDVYSTVTERPFVIEPESLGLSGPLDPRPLQFSIELHFPETSKVQSTDELAEDDPRLEPWTFPSLHWMAPQVQRWAEEDGARKQVLDDISEFVIAQRFFRMALDGYLGESFPVERLAQLARELAGAGSKVATSRTDP